MSLLEIAANSVMVAAVFLAARNHISTWPLGIVGCVLFAVLYFQANLFANVTLQFFFIITNFIGWSMWQNPSTLNEVLPVTSVKLSTIALFLMPLSIVTALIYGVFLSYTTDAALPIIDSLVLTFSITAQFLLMGRKLQSWHFWIVVNTVSVPLFASQGLYLTSFVYALFWVNAVYGYWHWSQDMKASDAAI